MTIKAGVGSDIRQFLTSRRARITPQQAGLPSYGGRRRVSGLRREEVAMLAGISVEYYTRLERGNARGVSDEVVEGLARALRLDDVERVHFIDLVRTANTSPAIPRRRRATMRVRPELQRLLDAMSDTAAFVRTGRLDVLSTNTLGRALYSSAFDDPTRPVNLARFVFLNPSATVFYRDWTGIASEAVGSLRIQAGQQPYDPALSELIGELSIRSESFRKLWATHDVKYYRSGLQPFHHPVVGDLDLHYDALEVAADPALTIVAYTAPTDSPAQQALKKLAAWSVPHVVKDNDAVVDRR